MQKSKDVGECRKMIGYNARATRAIVFVLLLLPLQEVTEMAKSKTLKSIVEKLLAQKASEKEITELENLGFNIKKPTKQTVIVAALYKKAANGDLSAIKELRSIVSDGATDNLYSGVVMIVDDIKNKNI